MLKRRSAKRGKAGLLPWLLSAAVAALAVALCLRMRYGIDADVQRRYMQGVRLAQSGQLQPAIAVWERVRRDAPELPETYYQLAVCYQRSQQPERAVALLQTLQRLQPDFPGAQICPAEAYHDLHDLPDALKAARAAVRAEPDSARAHAALSQAYGLNMDFGSCERELLRAEQLDPNDPSLFRRAAGMYQQSQNAGKTEPQARRCLQLDPDDAQSCYLLGWALMNEPGRHHEQEAEAALKRSLELDPANPRPTIEMGALLVELHRYAEGQTYLERARALAAVQDTSGTFTRKHLQVRARIARLLSVAYRAQKKMKASEAMLRECRQFADQANRLLDQPGN